MVSRSSVLGVAALALAASAAVAPARAEKWDMPLAYPATNYHSENAAEFGKCVDKGTSGKINIVTHPNGSLFKGNDIKRAVQTGQAPIGERLLSAHQNENALFGVDSVPFLATSFDDAEKLWKAARPSLEKLLEKQNLVLLYSVSWPPQGLYFKTAMKSVADMKGVKFRSYNAATARLAQLAGMQPVQIEAAELAQALATGVASSFISSGATGYDTKVWEHLKFFYEVDAWMPRNHIVVNKDVWGKLDADTQKAVRACADTAAAEGLKRAKAYTTFTLEGLKKGGMSVEKPSDQMKADLKKIGEQMTEEWLKKAGADGKAIVDAYKKM
ncbi:MAG: TRAP transporter substrate-binding protein [Hyphomicrobiaceae bacterium]